VRGTLEVIIERVRHARVLAVAVAPLLFLGVSLLSHPAVCHAASALTWTDGGSKAFSGTPGPDIDLKVIGGKHSMTLKSRVLGTFNGSGAGFDPQSAERLTNGRLLVADALAREVVEYTPSGGSAWSYSSSDNGSLRQPVWAKRPVV